MKPYKGYSASVTFDDDAMLFHGEVTGIRDVITFQARDAEGLTRAFHDSVDNYLAFCAEDDVPPEKPFSGTLSLRATPEQHRRMADAAARRALSLNQWIVSALEMRAEADLNEPLQVK
jgi:predicted HicB family RNase H-like nuclease